jgi:tetratricopeptide (TPR) repeat protein
MDYQLYVEKANAASKKFDENDLDGAMTGFEELVKSDISDIDKSMMCYNIARVCEKSGDIDLAIEWYDYGISLEKPHSRCYIHEHKAAFLANQRRDAEALAIYEALYTLPYITEGDKERIWKNMLILRNPRPA